MEPVFLSQYNPVRFPAICPKCLQPTGHVRSAGTVPQRPLIVRLSLRCQTCQHDWVIDTGSEYETSGPSDGLQDTPYASH